MAVQTSGAVATATTWQIDPAHTLVGFAGKHMMFTTVRGRFRDVQGTIAFDVANPANSSVQVEIDASTLESGAEQRDGHLRSPDFLDVDNHPKITFTSTKVEPQGADRARVSGELTIRGVTRPVVLDAKLVGKGVNPWGKEVVGFEAATTINRKDFGLTWNVALEAGGLLVGDQVKIELDVQAVKQD
jgi:polyisoprenoid-binding protein YceI